MPSLHLFGGKKKFTPSIKVNTSTMAIKKKQGKEIKEETKILPDSETESIESHVQISDKQKLVASNNTEAVDKVYSNAKGTKSNNECMSTKNSSDITSSIHVPNCDEFVHNEESNIKHSSTGVVQKEDLPVIEDAVISAKITNSSVILSLVAGSSDGSNDNDQCNDVCEVSEVDSNAPYLSENTNNIKNQETKSSNIIINIHPSTPSTNPDTPIIKLVKRCSSTNNLKPNVKTKRKPKANAKNADLNQNLREIGKNVDDLVMKDFIYYKPEGESMSVDRGGVSSEVCETHPEANNAMVASGSDMNSTSNSEDIGPRVMLNADGEVVIDQASLLVTASSQLHLDGDGKPDGGGGCKERRSGCKHRCSWSPHLTRVFYRALNDYGTDLSMIAMELDLPRWKVKHKFKGELRRRAELMEAAQYGRLTEDDLRQVETRRPRKKWNNRTTPQLVEDLPPINDNSHASDN